MWTGTGLENVLFWASSVRRTLGTVNTVYALQRTLQRATLPAQLQPEMHKATLNKIQQTQLAGTSGSQLRVTARYGAVKCSALVHLESAAVRGLHVAESCLVYLFI